ncbi:MAG: hypothetical protein KDK91_32485, partial [Gammaproteobacteria bacterium]|nr:hypothetical protein [Gammaproteobacteria bacterium]
GDGVADACDNCNLRDNPDQADRDADGAGDVCDEDDDNDGVVDSEDGWPLDPDYARDLDKDGMADEWERINGLDPLRADADENPDADTLSNGDEFRYGLDPRVDDRLRHVGAEPPTQEPGAWRGAGAPGVVSTTGSEHDETAEGGCADPCPAWIIHDDASSVGGLASYEIDLSGSPLVEVGRTLGWVLRARVRREPMSAADEAPDFASAFGYDDGDSAWWIMLGSEAGSQVLRPLGTSVPEGDIVTGPNNRYQLIELYYYPSTNGVWEYAELFVDGEFRTRLAGMLLIPARRQVVWGSASSTARARSLWNYVEWSVAPDADSDGIPNVVERSQLGTKPYVADTDGDGLLDGFEYRHGFDPKVANASDADSDGDGFSDIEEQAQGTDPTDAGSHPKQDSFEVTMLPNTAWIVLALLLVASVARRACRSNWRRSG